MQLTASAQQSSPRLPAPYLFWLGGSLASRLGDAALFFALGWAGTAHGGGAAGLILTAVTLPRTLLLLVGGAVADRYSVLRVLVAGDATMLVVTATAALAAFYVGSPVWLLLAIGLAVGVVDAFYIAASGPMPRRLVGPESLARAMALNQGGSQLVSLLGGPLGAVLVTVGGLSGVASADGLTFAIVLIVLIVIRPGSETTPQPRRGSIVRQAAEGVVFSVRHPILRPGLILTGAVAAFAIPVGTLLIPLLAREHHLGAGVAGLMVGSQAAGSICVALAVARRGAFPRIGLAAVLSVVPMTVGISTMALSSVPALAIAGGTVFGIGLGLFASHLAPLLLGASPETHLSRVQSLIALVQSAGLLITLNLLGNLADAAGAVTIALLCAGLLAASGVAALASRPIRDARLTEPS